MFLNSPNDKRFYSYLGTSVGPSQMKILFTSYYQNIAFRNTVLSQKFQACFFLLIRSCWNFAVRNELQKSSEIWRLVYCWCVNNVLFCSRFYNLLQCLSMIHKTGTNRRNDGIWRLLLLDRYLPLGNWMTRKLGRIIEKEIISPETCCRNVQFEIKLHSITHTWCSIDFARSLNKAIHQRKALLSMGFGKMSIKFHVSSLNKCQLV